MPVPTKLDPVALPEKGGYVEGPLLYAVRTLPGPYHRSRSGYKHGPRGTVALKGPQSSCGNPT